MDEENMLAALLLFFRRIDATTQKRDRIDNSLIQGGLREANLLTLSGSR